MPQTKRFIIFMELWFPQFHRFGKLGIPVANHERIPIAFGESS